MQQLVRTIVDAFLRNPFDVSAAARQAGERAIRALDLGAAVGELLSAGDLEQAKALVLAVGHYQACYSPEDPAGVLDLHLIPQEVWERLPRQRASYLRVVMAAGRCHAALAAVRGESASMQKLQHDVWAACFGESLRHTLNLERVIRDHDVLILGETGTGKEAFARAIQAATPGPEDGSPAPAAEINAAAVPETLVESALFGHVKGAFTGAQDTRVGRLRHAAGGSFFLDEVGDLPTTTQVKLLRVIETNRVYPVGSDSAHEVDVRYIAATHKDLESLAARREFRADLYQRLAGNVIYIPPLRERPDDIVEIGRCFMRDYLQRAQASLDTEPIEQWLTSKEARSYSWPGNVRELQNVLRNLMLGLSSGLTAPRRAAAPSPELPEPILDCCASMSDVSDWYLQRVLAHTEQNFTQASRILGIDRSTVRRRAKPGG